MAVIQEEIGDILVSLCYNAPKLTVVVLKCRDLPAKDLNGYSDPYVKLLLMNGSKKVDKKKTSVREKTLNPIYNESFVFNVSSDKIKTTSMVLQVMDHDKLGRNDFIGQIHLDIKKGGIGSKHWKGMLQSPGQAVSYWHDLEPGEMGDMLVSLCFNAPSGKLTVLVLKCRDLPAMDMNGYSDPYIRVTLLQDGKKLDKKKTSVREKTLNPVFNESFVFNVNNDKIRTAGVLLEVLDHDKLGRNDRIGEVELAAKRGTTESKHWNEMLGSKGSPVSHWHLLKGEN